jgi:hypothetical protein
MARWWRMIVKKAWMLPELKFGAYVLKFGPTSAAANSALHRAV